MQKTHPKFSSMPNFRSLAPLEGKQTQSTSKLYRSSRPDFLSYDEVEEFRSLGIKSIIDFRASNEYKKALGSKLLDSYYKPYKVKLPSFGDVPINNVIVKPLKVEGRIMDDEHFIGSHYFIDFFKLNYVWNTFRKAPLWFRLFSLLYLLYDVIFMTGYKYFIRLFAKNVINKEGLAGQYRDMVNHSKASIYVALKLLSEPENVPAMINCAHGKDRTGIVSAIVMSLLGKPREAIIADYARSTEELAVIKERVHFEIVEWLHMSPSFTVADADNMRLLLHYIDTSYGGVEEYLESFGFSRAEQRQLIENLSD